MHVNSIDHIRGYIEDIEYIFLTEYINEKKIQCVETFTELNLLN